MNYTLDKELTVEETQLICNTCKHSKWYCLLAYLIAHENEPKDLQVLDKLLKSTIPTIIRPGMRYPSSDAIATLNGCLKKAKVPFRITRDTRGATCYQGTVQVKRRPIK